MTMGKHIITGIHKDKGRKAMKRGMVLFLFLFGFYAVYSQDLMQLSIEIDSLQRQVERLSAHVAALQQRDGLKDDTLQQEEHQANTANELLTKVVHDYKNQKFDDLIFSSTKQSVQRDMLLFDDKTEEKVVLTDLEKYFYAKEAIEKKYDATLISHVQSQLNEVKQTSTQLDKMKENVEYYKNYTDELKQTVEKLLLIDGDGPEGKKAGNDAIIQELKLKDILFVLAQYMFNYYDFIHYPYLTDIVLEIIKRKQPDADADIKDLLIKLK